jgi:hypothetical protein
MVDNLPTPSALPEQGLQAHRGRPRPLGGRLRSIRSARRPGVHQEPPALPATPWPARCFPSPCAPPLGGSDYYEGSATPERHQLTASLPTQVGGVGSFPRSSLADRRGRCPAESRQPRHRYAAAFPRPPARPCAPRSESPTSTCRRACAASPAHIRQVRGRSSTYGTSTLVLALHLPVWQYRPVPSLSGAPGIRHPRRGQLAVSRESQAAPHRAGLRPLAPGRLQEPYSSVR